MGFETLSLACLLILADCQYSYLQQPPSQLTCNPFGSTLQLQCAVSGPSTPTFTIHWYMQSISLRASAAEGNTPPPPPPTPLFPSSQGYNVQNVALNDGALNKRTISSVLTIDMITEMEASMCFWCELYVLGYQHIRSNVLCILDETDYTGMSVCGDSAKTAINSSQVCVSLTQATLLNGMSRTVPVAQETDNVGSRGSAVTTLPIVSKNADVILQPSTHSVDNPTLLRTTSKSPMGNTDTDSEVQSSNYKQLQALYIAIAICAVFAVVITVMLVAILIMCRRKPCTKAVLYSQKYSNGQHMETVHA